MRISRLQEDAGTDLPVFTRGRPDLLPHRIGAMMHGVYRGCPGPCVLNGQTTRNIMKQKMKRIQEHLLDLLQIETGDGRTRPFPLTRRNI